MSLSVGREPNTMMKVVILTHNYRIVGKVYVAFRCYKWVA